MTSISAGQKKVMVQLTFISFVVGFLLSFAALGDSLALADGGIVTLTQNNGIIRSDWRLQDDTRMVDATRSIRLRGRKMVKEVGVGDSRLGCELCNSRPHRRVHFVGFVPFSADYRRPVNHPPKNN